MSHSRRPCYFHTKCAEIRFWFLVTLHQSIHFYIHLFHLTTDLNLLYHICRQATRSLTCISQSEPFHNKQLLRSIKVEVHLVALSQISPEIGLVENSESIFCSVIILFSSFFLPRWLAFCCYLSKTVTIRILATHICVIFISSLSTQT